MVAISLISVIHADVPGFDPLIRDVLPPLNSNHITADAPFDLIRVSNGQGGLFSSAKKQSVSASASQKTSPEQFPGDVCPPGFVGKPPNQCRAEPYIPIQPKIQLCPEGTYGEFPNCHEPCPAYHIGIPPQCVRARCPPGFEGDYQPNCTYHVCPHGTIGFYPNCYTPKPYTPCPNGQLGTYPDHCYDPCPPYRKCCHEHIDCICLLCL